MVPLETVTDRVMGRAIKM